MARDTLDALRYELRALTDAGQAEWTNGTATYWDNDQLDRVLDKHRVDLTFAPLAANPKRVSGGSLQWYEYHSGYSNFEQTSGGTSLFIVEDSTGADVAGTAYSVDYARGIVTFSADQGGTAYYVTGRSYDLHAAAADVWGQKAAHYAAAYDVSTDNHSLSRSQLIKHALQMRDYYAGQGGASVATLYRSDC